jgi:hypothetical protein
MQKRKSQPKGSTYAKRLLQDHFESLTFFLIRARVFFPLIYHIHWNKMHTCDQNVQIGK